MQFCPLCRTDPYTNPGSWLLLVPISQKQSETFQQMKKLWKRDIIRISAANFLYIFIQCYWFPLTQIRYMQSRRSYIKKKKNARTSYWGISRMYCIPQRYLYYIASSHLPKLNFMAVDLQLGTHIELEVNLNFRFLLCCCCYCCCCCFNIIYLLSRFPQLVYKCN